ncbi:DUF1722 domain-containing protein [Enterococcus sp. AZ072]|uniref:DUF1722 domain-containing protein n=1 Tax=unclassified Enterococcus TaxID=2608891 RepID=UPI003D278DFC
MNQREAQKEWARWKYYVMARSQAEYLNLRQLFSGNQWNEEKEKVFLTSLQKVQEFPTNPKAMRNAYEHVWGYFKKQATPDERVAFYQKLVAINETQDDALPYLIYLNEKYPNQYLADSKLFN